MINFFNKRFFIIFLFPLIYGGVTVLSFQPFNLFFINFISLPLLFFTIIYVKKKSKSVYRKKPFLKNLFILGTSFGFGFFFCGIYWITHSLTFDENFKILIPISLIIIPLFLSLFFSIPIMIAGNYLQNDISSIFLISFLFAISDFLRNNILSGFPWNLWSYSFSWNLEVLQILPIIGFFSFNIIIISILFSPCFFLNRKKYGFIFFSFFVILLFTNYFYGSYKINSDSNKKLSNIYNFKVVSAGMELSEFKNNFEVASKLVKFSEPEKNKKTIFIWPEGVFLTENFSKQKNIKDLFLKSFSDKHLIVFGANTKKKTSREIKYYNSMVITDRNLNILYQYNKKKLVPFGEFLPFENILKKFGVKKITAGYESFSKGVGKPIIHLNHKNFEMKILSLICYEIIFPKLTESYKGNFDIILNISEDAWFGKSIGPKQHFAKAIFRAIEAESFVIRSANKGISAFVDPNGKIKKTLKPNEIGNIELDIPINSTNKKQPKKDLIFLFVLITYIFTFFLLRKFKI